MSEIEKLQEQINELGRQLDEMEDDGEGMTSKKSEMLLQMIDLQDRIDRISRGGED